MADSAQARFSVFEVPGLMMTPLPHGADSSADRSQLNDIYAGIDARVPAATNQTCWTSTLRASSAWKTTNKVSPGWVNENKQTKVWTPEKEMVPC